MRNDRLRRAATLAGCVGPLWLGTTIAGLSVAQADFMRTLGWHPLEAPTRDWPSGLALGPHGAWLTAAFVGCGAMLPLFAAGLSAALPAGRAARLGPRLLAASGLAMALLAAPTDPTIAGVRTPAGLLHDAAFVLLGATLFPAMAALGIAFRRDPAWRPHAAYTFATLALAAPGFALKGAAFYLFLAAALLWFPATAARLARARRVLSSP